MYYINTIYNKFVVPRHDWHPIGLHMMIHIDGSLCPVLF